jgi:hypothetical protein
VTAAFYLERVVLYVACPSPLGFRRILFLK